MENSVLAIGINFISFKDSEEALTMHTNSHNIDIMMGNEKDEIIEKLFETFLQNIFTNYKKDLEEAMRGSKFVCDSIDLLYYQLQKIGLKWDGSNTDSPEWLKNTKTTINPKK